ncbi:ABC transporter permease [Falsiroseomonas ponticola]|uniref:ABC transporter permease n=1 Tax=Falsiroseomonas ponticola TaxID=2786951 RepID=UPI001933256C|nr:ABC transporter permease [Roseomonas ponticola]
MPLALRRLLADPAALLGATILAALLACALFGEHMVPFPDDAFDAKPWQRLEPPSAEFWFGTDGLGRDVFSRTIMGARVALLIALSVVAGAMLIGVPLGLLAGYRGGWLAEAVMRVTDVFQAVPQLVLALAFAAVMRPSIGSAMLALTLTYWPFFCRIVYGETRRVKSGVFIDALQAQGAGTPRILFLHVLPNVAPAIIVRATIGMGVTILVAATLGFLGMGAAPPTPEWGLMVAESRKDLPEGWWQSLFPGLAILLAVLGFNLVGDAIRDVADPRLRRSR